MLEHGGELDLAQLDRGRMVLRSPFLALFLHYGLGGVQAVMDFGGGELYKVQGPRSVSRLSFLEAGSEADFFLKRHRHPHLAEQLREFIRRGRLISSGRREWENIWRLRQLGILTVEPVAFGEMRRWGWETESFLITQELKEAFRLTEFIPQHFAPPLGSSLLARKRHLVSCLALLVHRMHEGGLFHRDLYLGHFFVKPGTEGGFELYLLDLQRVIQPKWMVERWRIKDLASLNFSAPRGWFTASDRLRFYMQYRQISQLANGDKSLIRRVIRKSRKIRAHTGRLLERGEIQKVVPWGWGKDVA